MNCKPGDLAIVVSASVTHEMIGAIVHVVRRYAGETIDGRAYVQSAVDWVCEAASKAIPLRARDGSLLHLRQRVISDMHLRPIRDSDGEDEMLRIVGKPEKVGA